MDSLIQKYKKAIMDSSNKEELLNELYREYKRQAVNYYDGDDFNLYWSQYITELISITHNMPLEYITDIKIDNPRINSLNQMSFIGNKKDYNKREIEDILDYLVYCGRKRISPKQNISNYDAYNVEGKCGVGSIAVDNTARTLGLNDQVVRIDPGFDHFSNLLNGSGFHYFNIMEYNDINYLIDVSYKQFFLNRNCSFERLGVPYLFPPDAGIFMMLDDERRKLAERLLKRGWVELTESNTKAYFDGFALSYRNGLYYEEKGKITFDIDYTAEDYKNFLLGIDNQVKHEGEEVLGYQRKPLKNPEIRFKQ